jgi:hypothetical protein
MLKTYDIKCTNIFDPQRKYDPNDTQNEKLFVTYTGYKV